MFLEPCQGFQNGFEHIFFRILRILYLTFCYSAALFSPVLHIFLSLPGGGAQRGGRKNGAGRSVRAGRKKWNCEKTFARYALFSQIYEKGLDIFCPGNYNYLCYFVRMLITNTPLPDGGWEGYRWLKSESKTTSLWKARSDASRSSAPERA